MSNDLDILGAGTMDAAELQKALTLGSDYATTTPGNLTGGNAMAMESLDATLRTVTFGMQHLRLWKDIIKESTNQIVDQVNIQNGFGSQSSGFYSMGSNPEESTESFVRDVNIVKYIGARASVPLNLTMINAAHGPVIARTVKSKTVEVLSKMERALFVADSAINPLEFDGIYKIIESKVADPKYKSVEFVGYNDGAQNSPVIDVRGDLTEDILEDAALTAINNFSFPADMYLDTSAHSKFSKGFYSRQRGGFGEKSSAGMIVPDFQGSLSFALKGNVFNMPKKGAAPTSASAAPVPSAIAVAVNSASEFKATDAGTYSYVVSAVYGDDETIVSAPVSIAVAAGQQVSAVLTFLGSPIYVNVYRAPKNAVSPAAADHQFIGRLAIQASATTFVIDRNGQIPGAGKALLAMHDAEALSFRQLGTLMKFDLAVVTTAYQFNILLAGAVKCATPRKHVVLKNVLSNR